ncbi:putative FmdB family regulatory protein [Kibdelosporangium banguiense]|uniref:FmdB family regulatory protein n=1 Tax=Kibdelosporangium banguiense TaxID=1365924 RepID=A0ABS4T9K9_9PSEU|nr:FmdB family zinc ribbon protein [Kibdelosporangium banguiense]MBP2321006.1 putative FmdB family regulatory protein [Kibdelosporangium banguiense]
MPTYQYACTVCDHRFEQVQAFTDPSLTVCPECSGKLRKLYGSVGVVFKGSGFYRTDSRSGSTSTASAGSTEKSSSKSSESTSSTSSSSSGTKSESTSSSSTPAAKAS